MHQIVELPTRQRSAAAYDADLLRDVKSVDYHGDDVCVLEIEDAGRAVGERVGDGLSRGDAAVGIEPLGGARYVRELGAAAWVFVSSCVWYLMMRRSFAPILPAAVSIVSVSWQVGAPV